MELSDLINELTDLRDDLESKGEYPKEGIEVMMECDYAQTPYFIGSVTKGKYIKCNKLRTLRTVQPDDVLYHDAKPCVILW